MMTANFRPITATLCLVCALIGGLSFSQVYALQSVLPAIVADLHVSPAAAGSTIGATLLAMALVSPFMGMVSDAFGRRGLMVVAAVLLAVPTAAICFAQSFGQIWFFRFVQGLIVPGMTVVLLAYLAEEFAASGRIRLTAFYISGSILGGFLGRFSLGYLNQSIGYRQAMLYMATVSILGAVLIWRNLPPSRHFQPNRDLASSLAILRRHLRGRQLYISCVLGFCLSFCLMACFTYINLHLAAAPYRFNTAQLADIFAVYLLGMVVTPLAGRAMANWGLRPTALAATICTAIGLFLSLHDDVVLIIVALALISCGIFVTQIAAINHLAQHIHEGRSLASGLYYTGYYTGGFCGTWLCGYAFAWQGWSATVGIVLLIQIVALTMCWRYMQR